MRPSCLMMQVKCFSVHKSMYYFLYVFFYTKYNHTQGCWFEWKISLLMVLSANDNHASEFEELFFFYIINRRRMYLLDTIHWGGRPLRNKKKLFIVKKNLLTASGSIASIILYYYSTSSFWVFQLENSSGPLLLSR